MDGARALGSVERARGVARRHLTQLEGEQRRFRPLDDRSALRRAARRARGRVGGHPAVAVNAALALSDERKDSHDLGRALTNPAHSTCHFGETAQLASVASLLGTEAHTASRRMGHGHVHTNLHTYVLRAGTQPTARESKPYQVRTENMSHMRCVHPAVLPLMPPRQREAAAEQAANAWSRCTGSPSATSGSHTIICFCSRARRSSMRACVARKASSRPLMRISSSR